MTKVHGTDPAYQVPQGFADVDLTMLVPAEWNYKEDSEDRQAKLRENMRRNGQVENVIVRQVGDALEVINGNHRLAVMRELGFPKAHVFNLGVVSDALAYRLAVETNETRFDTNNLKLAQLLKEIGKEYETPELALTMPFSEHELGNLSALLDFNWNDFHAAGEGGNGSATKEAEAVKLLLEVHPNIHARWLKLLEQLRKRAPDTTDEHAFALAVDITLEDTSWHDGKGLPTQRPNAKSQKGSKTKPTAGKASTKRSISRKSKGTPVSA